MSSTIPSSHAANITDGRAYASEAIHQTYRWLRENQPLGKCEQEGFDPFWVVTKHEDVQKISRDNELFKSATKSTVLTNQESTELVKSVTGGSIHLVESLVQIDNPMHEKLRAITAPWFNMAAVKPRYAPIQKIADKAFSKLLASNGQCDFSQDIALRYPLEVVMNILGVPQEDYDRMLFLTQTLFGPQDPDAPSMTAGLSSKDVTAMLVGVVDDFSKYFLAISEARRADPKDDLATLFATATIDGKRISAKHEVGYYMIIASAGHDTTSAASVQAMWALATVPGLLEEIQADLSLIPKLVEESIRFATPVKTFMRTASQDTELRGQSIKAGDWLMLCYASANRDEQMFEHPDTFDIHRSSNRRHLAFGNGGHVCLGQHLARLEITTLFETIIPQLKTVKLAGEAKLIQSHFVNGIKNLPIEFQLA